MSWPWSQLGLPGPSDLSEVRRAYAEKLKTTHPEDDPEGFQRLHSAYQLASRMARQQRRQAGGENPQPQKEEERPVPHGPEPARVQGDFSFDELLEGGEEDMRRPHSGDKEKDFDFDELLEEFEAMSRSQQSKEERDFDFDRLFAEGEAERAELRLRRAEERRKEQRRPFQERQRREERLNLQFQQEESRWQSTETILHTIETMYNAGAGAEKWEKFFQNPLFQQAKDSLDLIFGLEDFISTRDLPQKVRVALFLAYGFDKEVSRPELRPLYQMLLSAWGEDRQDRRQQRLYRIGTYIGGFLMAPLILVLLGSGGLLAVLLLLVLAPLVLAKIAFKRNLRLLWLLAFGAFSYVCYDRGLGLNVPLYILAAGFVCWVIRQIVKTGSMAKRANGGTVSKKEELRAMFGFAGAVAVLVLVMSLRNFDAEESLRKFMPVSDPREQVCRYMEKDFGIPFQSIYNRTGMERHANVFAPKDSVGDMFLAGPDGDRKEGRTGYTTNYPEMRMLWALKDFAKARGIAGVDSLDQGLEQWETSGIFLITLSEEGGEEVIEELGELLEELRQEKWYDALSPQCQIVLCSREMEEGRMVLIRVHPATEVYSVPQIQGLYKDSFVHAVCAQIIRELELDWDFLREEGEHYTLTNEGTAALLGQPCVKLCGRREDGSVAMEYYVYLKEGNIYCVPGDFWETGNCEEQMSFCRPLYWGDRGVFNLFYPWLRAA